MDPNDILKRALRHLRNDEFEAAEQAIGDYNHWRASGGYAADFELLEEVEDYADLVEVHLIH